MKSCDDPEQFMLAVLDKVPPMPEGQLCEGERHIEFCEDDSVDPVTRLADSPVFFDGEGGALKVKYYCDICSDRECIEELDEWLCDLELDEVPEVVR